MTLPQRKSLLDKIADLVDENLFGRSEMCIQFSNLLCKGLCRLGFSARQVFGKAIYFDDSGNTLFRWNHAWVRVGSEVIDGNIDSLYENPAVPDTVSVFPYWGPIRETPDDRKLREDRAGNLQTDPDVEEIWWPELRDWIDERFGQPQT